MKYEILYKMSHRCFFSSFSSERHIISSFFLFNSSKASVPSYKAIPLQKWSCLSTRRPSVQQGGWLRWLFRWRRVWWAQKPPLQMHFYKIHVLYGKYNWRGSLFLLKEQYTYRIQSLPAFFDDSPSLMHRDADIVWCKEKTKKPKTLVWGKTWRKLFGLCWNMKSDSPPVKMHVKKKNKLHADLEIFRFTGIVSYIWWTFVVVIIITIITIILYFLKHA